MNIYINKVDLCNELGKIPAPMEANDYKSDVYLCIDQEDGIDAIDIVLCKDCEYCKDFSFNTLAPHYHCKLYKRGVDETDFCSWGRRA